MTISNYGNNISSSTNIVNGVAYTQNVINLGGASTCSNGPSFCDEGYSIYVPCLKNITRGQQVCFQTYIADKGIQDTLDLNSMCGLTLQLTGPFGCPYNSYNWPDDINVLQREELSEVKCEKFNGNIVKLSLGYIDADLDNHKIAEINDTEVNIDPEGFNVNIKGCVGDFCEGSNVKLRAKDSQTHVFIGWTTDERIDELCDSFNIDDLIVSTDNVWTDTLYEDKHVYAVYRKRKTYKVKMSFDNRYCYFEVTYNGVKSLLIDKENNYVEVTEGYHFIAKCCPMTPVIKRVDYIYKFLKWSDNEVFPTREYFATDEVFKNGELRLYAICESEKKEIDTVVTIQNEIEPTQDVYLKRLPRVKELSETSSNYIVSDNIIDSLYVKQVYNTPVGNYISISKNGYISFDSGITEEGNYKVIILIDETCLTTSGDMIVKNSDQTVNVHVNEDEINSEYIFEFDNCSDGVFEIYSTFDTINIIQVCIFEKVILDKGKIELCIPPEDTLKFHKGVLNMNGAICVDDNWWGLDSVQVGVVNKLNPIMVTTEI